MSIAPDILAAQNAYAARPFMAYLRTDNFSAGFRFDTEAEAVAYVADQALRYRKNRRHGRSSTWLAELSEGPGNGVIRRTWDAIDITDGVL
jgi:hypothetical protein